MPLYSELLSPRSKQPERALNPERLCGPASSPTHPHPAAVLRLTKMSAKPTVGFVNEASRQIVAGGSAGKSAPPRRGLLTFPFTCPFTCPENVAQIGLPAEIFSSSKLLALSLSSRTARAKAAGSRRPVLGVPGQVAGARMPAALWFPAFSVPTLKRRQPQGLKL